jgi:manganese/iron transport system ATP-binding protein
MSSLSARIRRHGVDHEAAAPTLELDRVSVVYDGVERRANTNGQSISSDRYALQDVSFQLGPGRQVAIVGPNGAGKSTLLKVIVGTLGPSSGTVNIYGHAPGKHICIGYVPQRNQIDWSFPATVKDVVMMGRVGKIGLFRWPSRRDWTRVKECLARVNATHLAERQIGELSGGQQQRVFIARALAQGADLLLLDEPFSGLDKPSHDAILEILDSLHHDRVSVMVATHDLNLARERFDLVMLLNRRMIAYGPAEEVLESSRLLSAYGSSIHVIDDQADQFIVADECTDEYHEHED